MTELLLDTTPVNIFFQLTKVDEQKRLVYGRATAEQPDLSREIMDYASSKPNFQNWSDRAQKRSGGKSLGNVREMHGSIAAGKVVEINYNDADKAIDVGTYCSDDGSWQKILDGVLTGFSIGGTAKRYPDPRNPSFRRYTAYPEEISYVDSPCLEDAKFTMIKADGTLEERKLKALEPGDTVMRDQPLAASPPTLQVVVDDFNSGPPKEVPEAAGFVSPNLIEDTSQTVPGVTKYTDGQPREDTGKWSGGAGKTVAQLARDAVQEGTSEPVTVPAEAQPAGSIVQAAVAAFGTAIDGLNAVRKAKEAELQALGVLAGIARKASAPLAPFDDAYNDTDLYADPANWSWLVATNDHAGVAKAAFNSGKGRDGYQSREWNVLGRRLADRVSSVSGMRHQYNPVTKQINEEANSMANATLTKDVGALMQQIHSALNVAVDTIGKDPGEAKAMLMTLLGNLDDTDNSSSANTSTSSPSAPKVQSGEGIGKNAGTAKANAVVVGADAEKTTEPTVPPTSTMAAAADMPSGSTTSSSTSTSSESAGSSSAPGASTSASTTPADGESEVEKLAKQVAQLTTIMGQLATLVVPQGNTLVQKAIPAAHLAALIAAPEQKPDAILDAVSSGDRYALLKAAEIAGTKDRPDFAAVQRHVDDAVVNSMRPKFTKLMLASALMVGMPDFNA